MKPLAHRRACREDDCHDISLDGRNASEAQEAASGAMFEILKAPIAAARLAMAPIDDGGEYIARGAAADRLK